MSVTEEFRLYVLDQLAAIAPVRTRKMFGGIGVYSGDLFFALMDDDVLYFKVDDETRRDFQAAGAHPFKPFETAAEMTGYWNVPGEVLDDADQMAVWTKKAIAVS